MSADMGRKPQNIALLLSYSGTNYHGWQVQPRDTTVCGTIETALSRVTKETVKLTGCGRTDAGVHALRYCANFHSETTIPVSRIPLAVNSLLPDDIAVMRAAVVGDDFNAILSCKKKEYIYRIRNTRIRDPFLRERVWFYPAKLDEGKMAEGAKYFVGTHDFAAVRSVGTETKTTVRTVYWCKVERVGDEITVRVAADGFLYNMARAIVGTLVYCSEGKLAPSDIPAILDTRDRRLTGPTAPPQGLYLANVWYDGAAGELMGTAAPDNCY